MCKGERTRQEYKQQDNLSIRGYCRAVVMCKDSTKVSWTKVSLLEMR
jgi:hypothetical protein